MKAGCLLALALLAQGPEYSEMKPTRTLLFDHVSIAVPGKGPWRVLAPGGDDWREVPTQFFEDETGAPALHFRVRDLGSQSAAPPPKAAYRLRALAGDRQREAFMVPGEPAAGGEAQLTDHAYSSAHISLDFARGSGFYRNFRTGEGLLARSIGFRISGKALGLVPFERTDADFRFSKIRTDGGGTIARRRAQVAVRALVRWSDPKPSALFVSPDMIEQEILIDLPRALVLLGNAINVENWFELPGDARVLVPGADALAAPDKIPTNEPYVWIVVASPGGAFVHWLKLPEIVRALDPRVFSRQDDDDTWRVGYRIEDVEERWAQADPENDGVRMIQRVAWLGGRAFVKELETPGGAAALIRALDAPYQPWQLEMEPLE